MSWNAPPTTRSEYERARLQQAIARTLARAQPTPLEAIPTQARCTRCGRHTPAQARFCDRCGARVHRGPVQSSKLTEAVAGPWRRSNGALRGAPRPAGEPSPFPRGEPGRSAHPMRSSPITARCSRDGSDPTRWRCCSTGSAGRTGSPTATPAFDPPPRRGRSSGSTRAFAASSWLIGASPRSPLRISPRGAMARHVARAGGEVQSGSVGAGPEEMGGKAGSRRSLPTTALQSG
jgi:hypothetical protein